MKPKAPCSGIEQIPQHPSQERQSKDRIPQPGQPEAEPAKAPEQVVDASKAKSQYDCHKKLQPLTGNRKLHQPNSREKKPPASRAESS